MKTHQQLYLAGILCAIAGVVPISVGILAASFGLGQDYANQWFVAGIIFIAIATIPIILAAIVTPPSPYQLEEAERMKRQEAERRAHQQREEVERQRLLREKEQMREERKQIRKKKAELKARKEKVALEIERLKIEEMEGMVEDFKRQRGQ